jgi:hypothetical protein
VAIDIRAIVSCSLGTVISGNIGDDYIQGSGLIKSQGSVLIAGIITPEVGEVVTFEYEKLETTRSIPRIMRVLSSFADPFRDTTQVELGCKLTYLSDLKDPIDWRAFDDPQNSEFTEEDSRIVTLPIRADSIALQCLGKLGLLATSIPLTNAFSIAEFDFSSGYVSILSDLLVSEGYFGYLNENEVLQVESLKFPLTGGPVFDNTTIIDIGPIGVGELPGEAVTVSYSTLKLRSPDEEVVSEDPEDPEAEEEEIIRKEKINWELEEVIGSPETYIITYKEADGDDEQLTKTYTGATTTTTKTTYETIRLKKRDILASEGINDTLILVGSVSLLDEEEFEEDPDGFLSERHPFAEAYNFVLGPDGSTKWVFNGSGWEAKTELELFGDPYEEKEVPVLRVTTTKGPLIAVASSVATDYLTNGYLFFSDEIILSKTEETFEYDKAGNQTATISKKYETEVAVGSAISIRWATDEWIINYSTDLVQTEETVQTNETIEDYTKDVTTTRLKYPLTQNGQQEIAKAVEEAIGPAEMSLILNVALISGLVHEDTQIRVSRKGLTVSEERPPVAIRVNAEFADKSEDSDPGNGWRTESKSSLELALGSAAAQRRIELSMPFAPDDIFTGPPGGPFSASPSDAPQKAAWFGRVQNRLLLGSRNGMSIQVAPERLPIAPFSPIYIQAGGLTALYRTNGTNWAFDSNGVICSTDALFWGAIGGIGTFWFPVAPGITTLPSTPEIIDGQIDTTVVVLPYNETAIYRGRIRVDSVVRKFEYALELLTEVDPLVTRVSAITSLVRVVSVPSLNVGLAALVPQISISARVDVPAASVTLVGVVPEVNTGVALIIPVVASISLAALVPELIGRPRTSVFIPLANVLLTAEAPAVSTGTSVEIPVVTLTLTGLRPGTVGKLDTEAFDLFLLVEDDLLSLRNP